MALDQGRNSMPPLDDGIGLPARLGVLVIVGFFGILGGWAALAPLSGAVIAPAIVKVEGSRKTVQHLEGGTVREIRVMDGSYVTAGETLIVLDDTQAWANVDLFTKQHDGLRALEARFIAEQNTAAAIAFPDDLLSREAERDIKSILTIQRNEFSNRLAAYQGQLSLLGQKNAQLAEQSAGLKAQLVSYSKQLQLTVDELSATQTLYRQGYATLIRVRQLERAAAALEGQVETAKSDIAKIEQQIVEVKMQALQLRSERISEASASLREVQTKLLDIAPRLNVAIDTLSHVVIKAPTSGYVVGLNVFTVGGIVGPGDRLLDLVPDKDALIAEASIGVDDIKDVAPGMSAEIHLSAFKQRLLLTVRGVLTQVSADRVVDAKTGVPYYQAKVAFNPEDLEQQGGLALYPGMSATIMFKTADRTALQYLLQPLALSLHQAFREK